jgi:putative DNA primase/helicase
MSHEKQIFISLESEFRQAMSDFGIKCNQPLVLGGEIQRFSSNGKTDKNSWYFLYPQGVGYFGDWSRNITKKWQAQGLKLDEQQANQVKAKLSEVIESKKLAQGIIAKDSLALWQNLSTTGESLYLARKQISAFGLRFGKSNGSNVVYVSLRDADNKLWSLQKIFDNGSKLFLPGGKKNGCYHSIGTIDKTKPLYITEGYATGASVHMATGACTIIAFDAGNIEHVIYSIRLKYPKISIIIAADNDQYSDLNISRLKAESAANKYTCSIILPEFTKTDLKPTDFNDLHVLEGLEKVKEQLEKIENIDQQSALTLQQFKVSKKSIFYISHDKNGNSKELWLCSLIKLEAYFCDKDDNNHGILLSWHSAKTNKLHSWAMKLELLAGDGNEIFRKLLSEGVELNSSKKAKDKLLEYLATIRTDKKLTCLNKIGWDENLFILPDVIYPNNSNLVFQSELSHFSGFGTS